MILYPKAKINLGLNIIERRSDGYHNIETVFFPVPLTDKLIVENTKSVDEKAEIYLQLRGDKIAGRAEDNLVVRAFNLLARDYKLSSCSVTLEKNIPSQAGMGGGSSDAAAMLVALNALNNLDLSTSELQKYAARLGADCALFIESQPKYGEGIGDMLSEVLITDELKGKYLAIVKPPVAVSTKDAYQGVAPLKPKYNCRDVVSLPILEWKNMLFNDFETTVFAKYPLIGEIKLMFYADGAIFSQMSGSGSAVYAIYETEPNIDKLELFKDCFTSVIPLY